MIYKFIIVTSSGFLEKYRNVVIIYSVKQEIWLTVYSSIIMH